MWNGDKFRNFAFVKTLYKCRADGRSIIMLKTGPIGIFDSGYGGLTILKEIRKLLPQYDYLYFGDNARAPYGPRSFDVVYRFTLESVRYLFSKGCPLIILACNTASAKALRTIQQHDLPDIDPSRRVLGVIRPTVEAIGNITKTGHIGIFGTVGTVQSESYDMEIHKLYSGFHPVGHACPMWVPLIENGFADSEGADFFVKRETEALLKKDSQIDTIVLGCTHYPLLLNKIKQYIPENIKVVKQGEIVASSLADYLRRHPDMERRLSRDMSGKGSCIYQTTEHCDKFSTMASLFMDERVKSETIEL